ncbi:rod shape-determining protein MreC [Thermithiobacillus plumbiphilus]|uniref:Cell shape-determining protein MreC n=1 Tax=Thermithiobacillus plumbiphilus TaxID=1729899 RepID=A0ABU9D7E8_9PROT
MAQFSLLRPAPLLARLIFFLALALLLLFFDQRDQSFKRGWLLAVVYPIQAAAQAPEQLWLDAQDGLRSNRSLHEENQRMKQALELVKPKLVRLRALEQENRRLQDLLDAARRMPGRTRMARVVGASHDASTHMLTVDLGSRDGVFVGQGVIAASGIVGQVVRIGPFSSQVALLTDAGQSLPAQVLRTRKNVLVNGNGNPVYLSIPFLPHNADLRKGDVILSSGLGGVFPKGLPIGQVVSIRVGKGTAFSEVRVRPWVQMDRLEEVLLAWAPQPGAQAGSAAEGPAS